MTSRSLLSYRHDSRLEIQFSNEYGTVKPRTDVMLSSGAILKISLHLYPDPC
jgi:hypothetical protein